MLAFPLAHAADGDEEVVVELTGCEDTESPLCGLEAGVALQVPQQAVRLVLPGTT